jgi:hypothetical protein
MLPYCCQSPDTNAIGPLVFTGFAGKIESRRADSNPCSSLRVIIRALQGCARVCESLIDKPFSFLRFAVCCTVLRSRWCQSGVNITLVATSD